LLGFTVLSRQNRNASGVQVRFVPTAFEEWVKSIPGARLEGLDYKRLDEFEEAVKDTSSLPFLKRKAFRDEDEIRLVVEEEAQDIPSRSFHFDLAMIEKITLSPWLPAPLTESVTMALRQACGGTQKQLDALVVQPHTLLNNEYVKHAGEN